jgi:hypothetical protein
MKTIIIIKNCWWRVAPIVMLDAESLKFGEALELVIPSQAVEIWKV